MVSMLKRIESKKPEDFTAEAQRTLRIGMVEG
jgi:hypothetical protein